MLEKYYKEFWCKLNEDFEIINKKLTHNKFVLENEKYIVDILMLTKTNLRNDIKDINDLSDYVIIRDFDNQKKEIILFGEHIVSGEIKDIYTTKTLLKKLNYTELFCINQQRYTYSDRNITFNVVIIRNLGIFLEYKNKDDIMNIIKILNNINIKYNINKNNKKYIDLAFEKYIEGNNL